MMFVIVGENKVNKVLKKKKKKECAERSVRMQQSETGRNKETKR